MAHRRNKTKRRRFRASGWEETKEGAAVCRRTPTDGKLALSSRSDSSHRRAGKKTPNGSAALQTIVSPGTRQRRKRSSRRCLEALEAPEDGCLEAPENGCLLYMPDVRLFRGQEISVGSSPELSVRRFETLVPATNEPMEGFRRLYCE